jgi:hypothetical protein
VLDFISFSDEASAELFTPSDNASLSAAPIFGFWLRDQLSGGE